MSLALMAFTILTKFEDTQGKLAQFQENLEQEREQRHGSDNTCDVAQLYEHFKDDPIYKAITKQWARCVPLSKWLREKQKDGEIAATAEIL